MLRVIISNTEQTHKTISWDLVHSKAILNMRNTVFVPSFRIDDTKLFVVRTLKRNLLLATVNGSVFSKKERPLNMFHITPL
jgi:hypothetical protein